MQLSDIRAIVTGGVSGLGLAVAEQLGGVRRPWTVENESGRIHLTPATRPLARAT